MLYDDDIRPFRYSIIYSKRISSLRSLSERRYSDQAASSNHIATCCHKLILGYQLGFRLADKFDVSVSTQFVESELPVWMWFWRMALQHIYASFSLCEFINQWGKHLDNIGERRADPHSNRQQHLWLANHWLSSYRPQGASNAMTATYLNVR